MANRRCCPTVNPNNGTRDTKAIPWQLVTGSNASWKEILWFVVLLAWHVCGEGGLWESEWVSEWVCVWCAHRVGASLVSFGVFIFILFTFFSSFFFADLFSMVFSCSDTSRRAERPSSIYCLRGRKCINECRLFFCWMWQLAWWKRYGGWFRHAINRALNIPNVRGRTICIDGERPRCMERGVCVCERSLDVLLLIMIVAIKWIVFSYFRQNDLLHVASLQLRLPAAASDFFDRTEKGIQSQNSEAARTRRNVVWTMGHACMRLLPTGKLPFTILQSNPGAHPVNSYRTYSNLANHFYSQLLMHNACACAYCNLMSKRKAPAPNHYNKKCGSISLRS